MCLVALAATAAAQCMAPSTDPFSLANATGCSVVTSCQSALCSCVGDAAGSYPSCLASSAATSACSATATCVGEYVACLATTTSTRTNTSSACSSLGNNIYSAQLQAASASNISNTSLIQSCDYLVCELVNMTSTSCLNGGISSICNGQTVLTTAAPTTTGGVEMALTLRLGGQNWTLVLNSPTLKANLTAALISSLATELGVPAGYISITGLTIGSLVVDAAVASGSGVSAATLAAAANNAASSTTWLSSVTQVYSHVGTDSVTILSLSTLTAAPGASLAPGVTAPLTPAPTSSATGAAGMWGIAALAATAALFA